MDNNTNTNPPKQIMFGYKGIYRSDYEKWLNTPISTNSKTTWGQKYSTRYYGEEDREYAFINHRFKDKFQNVKDYDKLKSKKGPWYQEENRKKYWNEQYDIENAPLPTVEYTMDKNKYKKDKAAFISQHPEYSNLDDIDKEIKFRNYLFTSRYQDSPDWEKLKNLSYGQRAVYMYTDSRLQRKKSFAAAGVKAAQKTLKKNAQYEGENTQNDAISTGNFQPRTDTESKLKSYITMDENGVNPNQRKDLEELKKYSADYIRDTRNNNIINEYDNIYNKIYRSLDKSGLKNVDNISYKQTLDYINKNWTPEKKKELIAAQQWKKARNIKVSQEEQAFRKKYREEHFYKKNPSFWERMRPENMSDNVLASVAARQNKDDEDIAWRNYQESKYLNNSIVPKTINKYSSANKFTYDDFKLSNNLAELSPTYYDIMCSRKPSWARNIHITENQYSTMYKMVKKDLDSGHIERASRILDKYLSSEVFGNYQPESEKKEAHSANVHAGWHESLIQSTVGIPYMAISAAKAINPNPYQKELGMDYNSRFAQNTFSRGPLYNAHVAAQKMITEAPSVYGNSFKDEWYKNGYTEGAMLATSATAIVSFALTKGVSSLYKSMVLKGVEKSLAKNLVGKMEMELLKSQGRNSAGLMEQAELVKKAIKNAGTIDKIGAHAGLFINSLGEAIGDSYGTYDDIKKAADTEIEKVRNDSYNKVSSMSEEERSQLNYDESVKQKYLSEFTNKRNELIQEQLDDYKKKYEDFVKRYPRGLDGKMMMRPEQVVNDIVRNVDKQIGDINTVAENHARADAITSTYEKNIRNAYDIQAANQTWRSVAAETALLYGSEQLGGFYTKLVPMSNMRKVMGISKNVIFDTEKRQWKAKSWKNLYDVIGKGIVLNQAKMAGVEVGQEISQGLISNTYKLAGLSNAEMFTESQYLGDGSIDATNNMFRGMKDASMFLNQAWFDTDVEETAKSTIIGVMTSGGINLNGLNNFRKENRANFEGENKASFITRKILESMPYQLPIFADTEEALRKRAEIGAVVEQANKYLDSPSGKLTFNYMTQISNLSKDMNMAAANDDEVTYDNDMFSMSLADAIYLSRMIDAGTKDNPGVSYAKAKVEHYKNMADIKNASDEVQKATISLWKNEFGGDTSNMKDEDILDIISKSGKRLYDMYNSVFLEHQKLMDKYNGQIAPDVESQMMFNKFIKEDMNNRISKYQENIEKAAENVHNTDVSNTNNLNNITDKTIISEKDILLSLTPTDRDYILDENNKDKFSEKQQRIINNLKQQLDVNDDMYDVMHAVKDTARVMRQKAVIEKQYENLVKYKSRAEERIEKRQKDRAKKLLDPDVRMKKKAKDINKVKGNVSDIVDIIVRDRNESITRRTNPIMYEQNFKTLLKNKFVNSYDKAVNIVNAADIITNEFKSNNADSDFNDFIYGILYGVDENDGLIFSRDIDTDKLFDPAYYAEALEDFVINESDVVKQDNIIKRYNQILTDVLEKAKNVFDGNVNIESSPFENKNQNFSINKSSDVEIENTREDEYQRRQAMLPMVIDQPDKPFNDIDHQDVKVNTVTTKLDVNVAKNIIFQNILKVFHLEDTSKNFRDKLYDYVINNNNNVKDELKDIVKDTKFEESFNDFMDKYIDNEELSEYINVPQNALFYYFSDTNNEITDEYDVVENSNPSDRKIVIVTMDVTMKDGHCNIDINLKNENNEKLIPDTFDKSIIDGISNAITPLHDIKNQKRIYTNEKQDSIVDFNKIYGPKERENNTERFDDNLNKDNTEDSIQFHRELIGIDENSLKKVVSDSLYGNNEEQQDDVTSREMIFISKNKKAPKKKVISDLDKEKNKYKYLTDDKKMFSLIVDFVNEGNDIYDKLAILILRCNQMGYNGPHLRWESRLDYGIVGVDKDFNKEARKSLPFLFSSKGKQASYDKFLENAGFNNDKDVIDILQEVIHRWPGNNKTREYLIDKYKDTIISSNIGISSHDYEDTTLFDNNKTIYSFSDYVRYFYSKDGIRDLDMLRKTGFIKETSLVDVFRELTTLFNYYSTFEFNNYDELLSYVYYNDDKNGSIKDLTYLDFYYNDDIFNLEEENVAEKTKEEENVAEKTKEKKKKSKLEKINDVIDDIKKHIDDGETISFDAKNPKKTNAVINEVYNQINQLYLDDKDNKTVYTMQDINENVDKENKYPINNVYAYNVDELLKQVNLKSLDDVPDKDEVEYYYDENEKDKYDKYERIYSILREFKHKIDVKEYSKEIDDNLANKILDTVKEEDSTKHKKGRKFLNNNITNSLPEYNPEKRNSFRRWIPKNYKNVINVLNTCGAYEYVNKGYLHFGDEVTLCVTLEDIKDKDRRVIWIVTKDRVENANNNNDDKNRFDGHQVVGVLDSTDYDDTARGNVIDEVYNDYDNNIPFTKSYKVDDVGKYAVVPYATNMKLSDEDAFMKQNAKQLLKKDKKGHYGIEFCNSKNDNIFPAIIYIRTGNLNDSIMISDNRIKERHINISFPNDNENVINKKHTKMYYLLTPSASSENPLIASVQLNYASMSKHNNDMTDKLLSSLKDGFVGKDLFSRLKERIDDTKKHTSFSDYIRMNAGFSEYIMKNNNGLWLGYISSNNKTTLILAAKMENSDKYTIRHSKDNTKANDEENYLVVDDDNNGNGFTLKEIYDKYIDKLMNDTFINADLVLNCNAIAKNRAILDNIIEDGLLYMPRTSNGRINAENTHFSASIQSDIKDENKESFNDGAISVQNDVNESIMAQTQKTSLLDNKDEITDEGEESDKIIETKKDEDNVVNEKVSQNVVTPKKRQKRVRNDFETKEVIETKHQEKKEIIYDNLENSQKAKLKEKNITKEAFDNMNKELQDVVLNC